MSFSGKGHHLAFLDSFPPKVTVAELSGTALHGKSQQVGLRVFQALLTEARASVGVCPRAYIVAFGFFIREKYYFEPMLHKGKRENTKGKFFLFGN